MKKYNVFSKMRHLVLLLVAFMAGCASNGPEVSANPDTIAPTVTVTSPTDTALAVPINRKIHVGFSEEMDVATVSAATVTLKESVSGSNVPGAVTPVGTSVSFTPTALLKISTNYTCTIKGGIGGVSDLAENPMAVNFSFTFTTGTTSDTTAPIVTLTGAFDGETGLPVNRASTATFSEEMDPATLVSPATSFTVKETISLAPVAGVVTYFGNTATFKPTSNLKPSTQYTSTITTGAKDLSGNALISGLRPNPWKWTTASAAAAADVVAPTVTLTNPANLATIVPVDKKINATFSEAMSQATMVTANMTVKETVLGTAVTGTVAYDVQNNIATFSPLGNLKNDTDYTVTVTNGATDLAGNALVVPAVAGLPKPNPWTFRTAAASVPLVPLAVNLRSAASFGIAAQEGLTSTGVAKINGDVALYPLAKCVDSTGNAGASQPCLVKTYSSPTGLTVNGSIYWAGDPFDNGGTANSVSNDLNIAWVEGKNKVPTMPTVVGDQLSSAIPYLPGVYHNSNLGLASNGTATFDAGGDANAIFIFQVDIDFTDSGTPLLPSKIVLINGAQARNIWFIVGRDLTIGSGTTWNGNILAGRTVVINHSSVVFGRVLGGASGAGAVTITGDAPTVTTISVPQ